MSPQRLTPEEVKRAQELVSRVRGISSCRISVDGGGDVAEVHVVAMGSKSPKLVARDVESLLKAEMGIDLDYRKIGVVNLEADLEAPHPEGRESGEQPGRVRGEVAPAGDPSGSPDGVEEFPVEEFPSRFAFQSVNVFVTKGSVKAEVELSRDSFESFGTALGENPVGPPWRIIAEAALRAVSEFLDESTRLCLVEVLKVAVGEKFAFVVSVDVADERNTKSLAGCSIIAGNENQSVVYATLDAINRVIGKLEFKRYIEYKIR